jgi:hypothetical protein
MKQLLLLVAMALCLGGCAVSGPDGGYIGVDAPPGSGVVVDPPGPAGISIGGP